MSRLTPYNDGYRTCESTYAELRIYSGDLPPSEVTQLLRLSPSEVHEKGQTRRSRLGRTHVLHLNGWFLSSEGHLASKDLRRHLDWLLGALGPSLDGLTELQSRSDVRVTVACIWRSAHGHGGPVLWPEQMRRLAELDLEVGFDVYFFGDEPSSAEQDVW